MHSCRIEKKIPTFPNSIRKNFYIEVSCSDIVVNRFPENDKQFSSISTVTINYFLIVCSIVLTINKTVHARKKKN